MKEKRARERAAMRYANKTCVYCENSKSIDSRVTIRAEVRQIHFRLPPEFSQDLPRKREYFGVLSLLIIDHQD